MSTHDAMTCVSTARKRALLIRRLGFAIEGQGGVALDAAEGRQLLGEMVAGDLDACLARLDRNLSVRS